VTVRDEYGIHLVTGAPGTKRSRGASLAEKSRRGVPVTPKSCDDFSMWRCRPIAFGFLLDTSILQLESILFCLMIESKAAKVFALELRLMNVYRPSISTSLRRMLLVDSLFHCLGHVSVYGVIRRRGQLWFTHTIGLLCNLQKRWFISMCHLGAPP
jgi:hypothetical protein